MLDNFIKYQELRKKYKTFIYENYKVIKNAEEIILEYHFIIEGLTEFRPRIVIPKKQYIIEENIGFSDVFAFHIGMVELISYWKATCSPKVIIKCGNLNNEQKEWFKKLYYYGLGELFFTNGIKNTYGDFLTFEDYNANISRENINETIEISKNNMINGEIKTNQLEDISKLINLKQKNFEGYIFPIGGGKDSCVTIEILKELKTKNYCLIVNPKPVTLSCAEIAGYGDDEIIVVNRKIDKNLIDLNSQGFINGHTPFSSLLAFITYYMAFLTGKKYIALSNEVSSNESNVFGEKINHQYSKSIEFENDFRFYVKKYIETPIEYFSFLRPLNELQIASIFSRLEKYHNIFKSCNVGSKEKEWKWCCNCPKCMFVYIILSPFLYKEKLVNIFGEDLFEKKELLNTFIELTGNGETKPFECVGTFEEVCFAITKLIVELENNGEKLPYMLEYYKINFKMSDLSNDILSYYNTDNNLTDEQNEILRNNLEN